jgi:diacylglycerol O-acyltransferase-1
MQPIVEGAVADLDSANHLNIISALLKLAIPSTAVWLIFFYVYFHLTLNLLAELLRCVVCAY